MTNEILTFTSDGTPVIDTFTIAQGVNYPHKNVIALCRKHIESLKKFGGVEFIIQPFETAGGPQKREVAILNEDQATLLMALMQNNETVVTFKVRLIQAFRACRDELAKAKAVAPQFQIPQTMQEALRLAADQMDKNAALQKQIEADAPKVSAYNDLVDDSGLYTTTAVAKILQMKRNELLTWAANNRAIYKQGKTWLPYAPWTEKKWAQVKIDEGNNKTTGDPYSSKTLRFTTSGVFQIHKLMKAQNLKVPEQLDLEI